MSERPLNLWNERVNAVCGRFETRYDQSQSLFIGELRKASLGAKSRSHRSTWTSFFRSPRGQSRSTSIRNPLRSPGES